jgi:hypothetical protein
MKQTAVEWLLDELTDNGINLDLASEIIEQAKEMEKQQQDKFAIDFYNWICSEEAVDLIQDLQIVGELNKIVTTEKLLELFKNK